MGRLVDGEWIANPNDDADEEFEREETSFRNWIEDDPDARFRPESGRYHLYVARACPWAHRTTILRRLRGLEGAISMSVVEPVREDDGWEFSGREGTDRDPILGADYLRELYVAADPEFTGRVTVPTLWDREEGTIVNNESAEIMRMFDTVFDGLAENDVSFYPEGHREVVDRLIEQLYQPVNNGVYRAGFAGSQEAYDEAVTDLFDALDRWEAHLAENRYLAGSELTEADWCLFTTLYRFDEVYHTHFKCNVRQIVEYPNLWNYLKELYQIPGVAETCNMEQTKEHYYRSHETVNPKRLVPKGPDPDFEEAHDRERLVGGPPEALRAIASG